MIDFPYVCRRRIGHAPSLCLTSPSSPAATVPITTSIARPPTAESYNPNASGRISGFNEINSDPRSPPVPSKAQYGTAPSGLNGTATAQLATDELGALRDGSGARGTIDHPGYGSSRRPGSRGQDSSLGGEGIAEPRTRRRPSANAQNRLTITNISEKDAEEGISAQVLRTTTTPPRATQKAWPTAENEKKTLYENAVAQVEKVQGRAAMASVAAASDVRLMFRSLDLMTDGDNQISSNVASRSATSKKSAPWPTAEAEKIRLYESAQATAKRTQAYGVSSSSIHSRSSSEANSPPPRDKSHPSNVVPGPTISAGAALYQQAVSSLSSTNTNNRPATSNGRVAPPSPPSSTTRVPHYPSAEEEKAALKRYNEARQAVDRNQSIQFASQGGAGSSAGAAAPVYDSLFPQADGSGQVGGSDMPPPFEASGSSSRPNYLNEKERLRRQYEAQDAAALAAQAPAPVQAHTLSPSHTANAPSYAGPPPLEGSGLSEKEILKRRLEEQDRVAQLLQQQREQQEQSMRPQSPPRVNGSRAPPVPPTMNGFKPLTAAEEKAQLRAKYEAEQQAAANGHASDEPPSRHPYATATPTSQAPPPPLMPRPPVEYIQETQEADLRARYYDSLGVGLASALDTTLPPAPARIASPVSNPHLDVRPFSPFDTGLGYDLRSAMVSPPPTHGRAQPPSGLPPPPPQAQY